MDGDGFGDVLVGAFQRDGVAVDEGRTYLFRGAAAGVEALPSRSLASPGSQAGAYFGRTVALADDFDGDGYADGVVGAYAMDGAETDQGAAFVYRGGPYGPSALPDVTLDDPVPAAADYFGRAVAGAGDLDGDGYDDLAVGAPRWDGLTTDEGTVFVFPGGSEVLPLLPAVSRSNPDAQAGWFGLSVSGAGDVDGDGYGDLVVGAAWQADIESGEGAAYVYLGGPDGLGDAPATALPNPAHQLWGLFGNSVL
jgi:hypothetical protein